MEELNKLYLAVGWFESARYDDNTPVAGVMAVQEFGSTKLGIPPRPALRNGITDNISEWKTLIKQLSKSILNGADTAETAMEKMGLRISGQLRKSIANLKAPPLSPVTIALRKYRRDNPQAKIGKGFVNTVRQAVAEGKTGRGELGDQSFGNKNPLDDSGYAIASLTYKVGKGE